MGGENGELVEELLHPDNHGGKADHDLVRSNDLGGHCAFADAKRIRNRRVQGSVIEAVHGVGNVFSRERDAIGEAEVLAQIEADGFAVGAQLP